MLHLAERLGERCEQGLDRICLFIAAGMAGIGDDDETPTRCQKAKCVADGSERGLGAGEEGFVCAGEVAEVEEDDSDLFHAGCRKHFGHVLVPAVVEVTAGGDSMLGQPQPGLLQGFLLHVKGIYTASGSDLLSEEEGIVTIAHGGVDGVVTGAEDLRRAVVCPVDG